MTWLDEIRRANRTFKDRVTPDRLPTQRTPCPNAVITCMDPRINLEAIGVSPFASDGTLGSDSRIIRTIGGLHDIRSLVIGIHLAGVKEIAVVMHTDCGCRLAREKIDTIAANMASNLTEDQFDRVKRRIGEPFQKNLIRWLGAFEDPYTAVVEEVRNIRDSEFVPADTVLHGLVYDLASGSADIVVNGYGH